MEGGCKMATNDVPHQCIRFTSLLLSIYRRSKGLNLIKAIYLTSGDPNPSFIANRITIDVLTCMLQ